MDGEDMPSRIIKETVCTSPTIDLLTADEERCFYRLWTKCDDFGRYDGRPEIVLGTCFPLKAARGEIKVDDVEGWLRKLNNVDLIQLYTVKDTRYLQVVTWEEHQQRRASKSKYPDPPPDDITCQQLKSLASNCEQMLPYSYSYSKTNSRTRTELSSDDDGLNYEQITDLWNEVCGNSLSKVRGVTPERRKHIKARCSVKGRDADWWRGYFTTIVSAPFLTGKNKQGWKATFDFAIRSEDVVAKVQEGQYSNGAPITPQVVRMGGPVVEDEAIRIIREMRQRGEIQ